MAKVNGTGQWRIDARALWILGVWAKISHNFWVLIDPDGNVVDQIHGFAVDPSGEMKGVGTAKDLLLVVKASKFSNYDFSNNIKEGQPAIVAAAGDYSEIMEIWEKPDPLIAELNAAPWHYPDTFKNPGEHLYFYNSNSVFNTMGKAMGFGRECYPDTYAPGIDLIVVPNKSGKLLAAQ